VQFAIRLQLHWRNAEALQSDRKTSAIGNVTDEDGALTGLRALIDGSFAAQYLCRICGLIATGRMAVQFMKDSRPTVVAGQARHAPRVQHNCTLFL
jgi:hypothetical protein